MIADLERPLQMGEPRLRFCTTPNRSLGERFEKWVFAAIAMAVLLPALVLAGMGAWPVLPFAGLEVLLLVWAFRVMRRRCGDFELLEIDDTEIRIEIRQDGRRESRTLNRHWAKLIVRSGQNLGERVSLSVRSHGRETLIGRYMNDEDRLSLAARLGKWMQTVRLSPASVADVPKVWI